MPPRGEAPRSAAPSCLREGVWDRCPRLGLVPPVSCGGHAGGVGRGGSCSRQRRGFEPSLLQLAVCSWASDFSSPSGRARGSSRARRLAGRLRGRLELAALLRVLCVWPARPPRASAVLEPAPSSRFLRSHPRREETAPALLGVVLRPGWGAAGRWRVLRAGCHPDAVKVPGAGRLLHPQDPLASAPLP